MPVVQFYPCQYCNKPIPVQQLYRAGTAIVPMPVKELNLSRYSNCTCVGTAIVPVQGKAMSQSHKNCAVVTVCPKAVKGLAGPQIWVWVCPI